MERESIIAACVTALVSGGTSIVTMAARHGKSIEEMKQRVDELNERVGNLEAAKVDKSLRTISKDRNETIEKLHVLSNRTTWLEAAIASIQSSLDEVKKMQFVQQTEQFDIRERLGQLFRRRPRSSG